MFTNPTVLDLLLVARAQDIARSVALPTATHGVTAVLPPHRPGVVHRLLHLVNRNYAGDCAMNAAEQDERHAA